MGAAAIAGVVAGGLLVAATPARADALDKKPFTATAAELLAAAKTAPAGDWPVVVLHEDDEWTFDADGRSTRRWRMIFVVRSAAGVADWGTLTTGWSPFYQDKPVVRARVIAANATVTDLDQGLVTDTPAFSESATIFSDSRLLEVPLPRLAIGSVVEQEVSITDREPLLRAGSTTWMRLGNSVPTLSTRVRFTGATKRRLAFATQNLPAKTKPAYGKTGDSETWTYTFGRLDPDADTEDYVDGDTAQLRYIGVSTGASWNAIATEYAKLVDDKIAEGPVSLPAGISAGATEKNVAAITAWLHEHVRYTGIELGQSAIVPFAPAETEKRGFGDCKDKSTLLVALLRKAGIDAELALLSAGAGLDIDPRLPGMGVFDHAIVRARIGKKDIWIDATADLYPPGLLPPDDQGRRALIASSTAKALVSTPASTAADNTVREVRTFTMAELGESTATEVSRESGMFEPGTRAWIRDTRAEDVTKSLGEYATEEYRGELARYSTTDVNDLATPFEITTVVTKARRGYTDRDQAEVYLYPNAVFRKVPGFLTAEPDPAAPARKHPFVWHRPHVYEVENRIVMPVGFTPPPLPADRTIKLGSATFTERDRIDGSTVVITYRFDTGKRTMTPAELTALRAAIAPLQGEERHLAIDHTGAALARQGKAKEAIAEIEKLIKLHPKEALHHTQLAEVYAQVAMGNAARRSARKAVQLQPKDADAHVMLGWVLIRDTLGRPFVHDFDRKGAIEAYKKARALDPKHYGAMVGLADTLQRGTNGHLLDAGSDPKAAAVHWKAAFADDETDHNAVAVMRSLLASGDHAGCEKFARARPPSMDRDAYVIAAIAIGKGTDAALAEAKTLRGRDSGKLVDGALDILALLRRYDEARALAPSGDSARTNALTAGLFKRITKREATKVDPGDPKQAVTALLVDMLALSSTARFLDADVKTEVTAELVAGFVPPPDVPLSYFADAMAALLDAQVDGPTKGPWRVSGSVGGHAYRFYVALDHGKAVLVGTPMSARGVGRYATTLLAAGDEDGARRLLDWLASDAPGSSVTVVWGGSLPRDKGAIALAVALTSAPSAGGDLTPLRDCKSNATGARARCDLALAVSLSAAKKWTEMLAHTEEWTKREPSSIAAIGMRANALAELGKADEARKVAADALAAHPGEELLVAVQAQVEIASGDLAAAAARADAWTNLAAPSAMALNQAAWLAAIAPGGNRTRAVELANAAVQRQPSASPPLNTLSVAEVAVGELGSAATHGLAAMTAGSRRAPADEDYFFVGLVAEALGLRDDAIAAYRRVGDQDGRSAQSCYALATARLKALGAKR
jgi:tetratricopeptide (TPR) repeat protein